MDWNSYTRPTPGPGEVWLFVPDHDRDGREIDHYWVDEVLFLKLKARPPRRPDVVPGPRGDIQGWSYTFREPPPAVLRVLYDFVRDKRAHVGDALQLRWPRDDGTGGSVTGGVGPTASGGHAPSLVAILMSVLAVAAAGPYEVPTMPDPCVPPDANVSACVDALAQERGRSTRGLLLGKLVLPFVVRARRSHRALLAVEAFEFAHHTTHGDVHG